MSGACSPAPRECHPIPPAGLGRVDLSADNNKPRWCRQFWIDRLPRRSSTQVTPRVAGRLLGADRRRRLQARADPRATQRDHWWTCSCITFQSWKTRPRNCWSFTKLILCLDSSVGYAALDRVYRIRRAGNAGTPNPSTTRPEKVSHVRRKSQGSYRVRDFQERQNFAMPCDGSGLLSMMMFAQDPGIPSIDAKGADDGRIFQSE